MRRWLIGLVAAAVMALGLTASDARAQVNREIYLQNNCHYPLRIFVHHQHADGQWVSHGWYDFAPNAGMVRMLGGSGAPLMHIEGRELWFYAEVTQPGVRYFWEGDGSVTFNGLDFNVMLANLRMSQGRMYFQLTCPGV